MKNTDCMDDFGSKFNVAAKFVFNVIKLQKAFLNYARPTGRHDKQEAVVSVDKIAVHSSLWNSWVSFVFLLGLQTMNE